VEKEVKIIIIKFYLTTNVILVAQSC